MFICLAHFPALFLITHLSSLCHCFSITNSDCISPIPVARRLGLANIVHSKIKPAFRDLRFACNGFWLFIFTGAPSPVSTPANVPFNFWMQTMLLCLLGLFMLLANNCAGCCSLHPTPLLTALLFFSSLFKEKKKIKSSVSLNSSQQQNVKMSLFWRINDFCGHGIFMVKEFSWVFQWYLKCFCHTKNLWCVLNTVACARIKVLVTLLYSYNPHCMEPLCFIHLMAILTLPCASQGSLLCNRTLNTV